MIKCNVWYINIGEWKMNEVDYKSLELKYMLKNWKNNCYTSVKDGVGEEKYNIISWCLVNATLSVSYAEIRSLEHFFALFCKEKRPR